MNLFAKQKQRHRCKEHTHVHQGGETVGINRKLEIDIYTLLCLKQVTNENLLYSTGKNKERIIFFIVGHLFVGHLLK